METEINIQTPPSFQRGIYRKTRYYTTSKAFQQFVTIRCFFLRYFSSFCTPADPQMTNYYNHHKKRKRRKKPLL